jgi:hypothetical protein
MGLHHAIQLSDQVPILLLFGLFVVLRTLVYLFGLRGVTDNGGRCSGGGCGTRVHGGCIAASLARGRSGRLHCGCDGIGRRRCRLRSVLVRLVDHADLECVRVAAGQSARTACQRMTIGIHVHDRCDDGLDLHGGARLRAGR